MKFLWQVRRVEIRYFDGCVRVVASGVSGEAFFDLRPDLVTDALGNVRPKETLQQLAARYGEGHMFDVEIK